MRSTVSIATMLATLALGASAQAGDLITNGGFESTSGGAGQINYETTLTGWTVPIVGYTFVGDASQFIDGVPDGFYTDQENEPVTLALWSEGMSGNGGLGITPLTDSPAGGDFIAQDGTYMTEPLTQTITGLTTGQTYTVGFYWAGAQQTGYYTATTEKWTVSLGGQTQSTPVLNDVAEGFTGWQREKLIFTATGASEVLSFLAVGTPGTEPPFSLLDGVTLYEGAGVVPEPAAWTMVILGVAGIGAIARRRRALTAAVA